MVGWAGGTGGRGAMGTHTQHAHADGRVAQRVDEHAHTHAHTRTRRRDKWRRKSGWSGRRESGERRGREGVKNGKLAD